MTLPIHSDLGKHIYDFETFLMQAKCDFNKKWTAEFQPNAEKKDFIFEKTIGKGSFGQVMLGTYLNDNTIYAIKLLDKKHIVRMKQVRHVHSELRILDATEFDFLVHLDYYFKDNCYLYLVLPFINGGELFTHLRNLEKFDETMSRFYTGQVILAIEYLHYMGIVYRDLKPENILVDREGYIKLTDFGFCKKVDETRTWTLCGTPEYLAPEVILSYGYNRSADWWAIGILMYELAAGYTPFYCENHMKLYDKITSGKYEVPMYFSKSLTSLIGHLLEVDRSKRYGVLKHGSKDVKSHEWFRSLDWDALLARKVKPSYRPQVMTFDDTTNFDTYIENTLRENSVEEYKSEFMTIKGT